MNIYKNMRRMIVEWISSLYYIARGFLICAGFFPDTPAWTDTSYLASYRGSVFTKSEYCMDNLHEWAVVTPVGQENYHMWLSFWYVGKYFVKNA